MRALDTFQFIFLSYPDIFTCFFPNAAGHLKIANVKFIVFADIIAAGMEIKFFPYAHTRVSFMVQMSEV